jgi:hypothetical protein
VPRLIAILTAALFLALPAGAFAASEDGDAGDLPGTAQDLTSAPVDAIDGSIGGDSDQDLYRVCLEGGGGFSATTVGGSELDTQLFLFDADGLGVYANDDSEATRQSTLPALDPRTPAAPGFYLLAVTPYDRDPQSPAGAIFPAGGGVLGPTGPGASQPLSGWAGRIGLPGSYRVALTGTAACAPPDNTPPTVDLTVPEDGAEVSRGSTVSVAFSCADEGGSGLASCEGSVANGEPLDTATLGPRAVTVTARDNAGNETVVTHTAQVVDLTPPAISLRTPLDGAVYLLDEAVAADYDCADDPGGSGLASCAGDVADGEPVDTAAVGDHTFTVTAADFGGGTASASSHYRVLYDFRGFRRPTEDPPAVNRARAGLVLAVGFSLHGFHGRDVLAAGSPQVAEVECGAGAEPAVGEPARLVGGRRPVRWSRRAHSYLLLWRTRRSWAGGCRQFLLGLADGTVHRAEFRFNG